MPLKSVEDHLQYYYRTDHHANTAGILKAYRGIYNACFHPITRTSLLNSKLLRWLISLT
jgi:hypothetical protein